MQNTHLSFAQWQAGESLLQPYRFRRQAPLLAMRKSELSQYFGSFVVI
jgi:hypothetical protein